MSLVLCLGVELVLEGVLYAGLRHAFHDHAANVFVTAAGTLLHSKALRLPASQRGRSYEQGIAHVIDWYRTFALLAGAELGLVRRPAKWFSPW